MGEPLVSVVTAVYNGETYLEECIKSVLGQTHQELEYIICNNHSTDRSKEIALSYAARDPRVRVIQPEQFLPQVKNFNYAFQQLSPHSQYCKMVHADDWIYPQCVKEMSALAEANPRVDLVSAYRLLDTMPDCFGVPVNQSVFSGREACRWYVLGTAYTFGSQTTVMYRSDAVRSRWPKFFPEDDRFFFDVDIAFRILADRDFGFVHQVLTYSRTQRESVTDKANMYNAWLLLLVVTLEQYGRDLLSPQEFEKRSAEVNALMYRGFGEVWLKDRVRKNKREDFWDFQRKYLGAVGVQIQPKRLAHGVLDAALGWLSSPGDLAALIGKGYSTGKL